MSSSHDQPDAVAAGVALTQLSESWVMPVVLDASAAKKNADENIATATVVAIPDLPELANAVWKEDPLPRKNAISRMPLRITQISAVACGNSPVVFALHSDGSIFKWSEWDGEAAGQWTKLPPIPDDAGPVKSPPYVPPGKRLL